MSIHSSDVTPNPSGLGAPDVIVAFPVGASSIGLRLPWQARSSQQERDELVLNELWKIETELHSSDDPAELAAARLTTSLDPKHPSTPLMTSLNQLQTVGLLPAGCRVEILVIATGPTSPSDNYQAIGTEPIGHTFVKLVDAAPEAFGNFRATACVARIGQLGDTGIPARIEAELQAYDSDILTVIPAGSGSFNLVWDMVVAVTQCRKNYQILDPHGRVWRPGVTGPEVVARWLVRYGQPALAAETLAVAGVPATDHLLQALQSRADSFDRVSRNVGSPNDLAAWARKDLRLRDLAETVAFRAWVEAEYLARFDAEVSRGATKMPSLLALVQASHESATLGEAIGEILNHPRDFRLDTYYTTHRSSTTFLIDCQRAASRASKPAHCSRRLGPTNRSLLLSRLPHEPTALPAESQPTGRLAWIWAAGTDDPPYADGFAGHNFSMLAAMHTVEPEPLVKMATLIVATSETIDTARKNADQLQAGRASPELGLAQLGIQQAGTHFEAREYPQDTQVVRERVHRWLRRQKNLDAIVLPVTGERRQSLGVLEASIAFASQVAIPVYVIPTLRGSGGNGPLRLRLLARATGLERPILQAVQSSLDTLHLRTAQRLADLITEEHPELEPLIGTLVDLFQPREREPDSCMTRAQLEICAKALSSSHPVTTRPFRPDAVTTARVLHIAAEHARHAHEGNQDWARGGPASPYRHLIWARDALQVNHGDGRQEGDVDKVVRDALTLRRAANFPTGPQCATEVVWQAMSSCSASITDPRSLPGQALLAWERLTSLLPVLLDDALLAERRTDAIRAMVNTPAEGR